VSRELRRNVDGRGRYRATAAHALAYHRASRPKPGKLVQNLELRAKVEADLAKKYSPEQIAGRLKVEFPDRPEMQVSTETIYQALYVQSRGALKRDLTAEALNCRESDVAIRPMRGKTQPPRSRCSFAQVLPPSASFRPL
jgi:IS30 family transposase